MTNVFITCYSENDFISIKDEMCKLISTNSHYGGEAKFNDLDLNFLSGYPEIINFIDKNKKNNKLYVSKCAEQDEKESIFNLFIYNGKANTYTNCKYLGIGVTLKKDKGHFTKAAIKK